MVSIRRILAPTDFSDSSAPAVRYAAEMAEKFSAELILLHVVQDLALVLPDAVMPTPMPAADLTQLIDAARTGFIRLALRFSLPVARSIFLGSRFRFRRCFFFLFLARAGALRDSGDKAMVIRAARTDDE